MKPNFLARIPKRSESTPETNLPLNIARGATPKAVTVKWRPRIELWEPPFGQLDSPARLFLAEPGAGLNGLFVVQTFTGFALDRPKQNTDSIILSPGKAINYGYFFNLVWLVLFVIYYIFQGTCGINEILPLFPLYLR